MTIFAAAPVSMEMSGSTSFLCACNTELVMASILTRKEEIASVASSGAAVAALPFLSPKIMRRIGSASAAMPTAQGMDRIAATLSEEFIVRWSLPASFCTISALSIGTSE